MANHAKKRTGLCIGAALGLATLLIAPPAHGQCEAGWTTHLPTSRTEADAAFDSTRRRVVLFGGIDGAALRGDTWEHDGTAWRLAATSGPSPRRGHKLVFDSLRGRTYLIGGYTGSAGAPVETWAWDGATWRIVNSAGPAFAFTASAHREAAAAFDQARGRIVLLLASGQTWELNAAGGSWQQKSSTGPSARQGAAMGFDRIRGRVRLFGGIAGSTRQADTWEWDGAQWTTVAIIGTAPSPRSEARISYDPVDRRLLMYGGIAPGSTRLRDLWALSGSTWTQLSTTGSTTPAGGAGAAMAFDATRQQLMLIGGSVAPWTDLCTMSTASPGASWMQAEFGPPARSGMAGAYDQTRGRMVMFGGLSTARLGDTWEFDGGAWRPIPAPGPSPRNESAMAYDPMRRTVVLFGGNTGAVNGETWEYSGIAGGGGTWSLVSTSGPSARERHSLVYDPNLRGVLLHGGAIAGGASNNQTWLWNGATWTQLGTGPTRAGHAAAYSPPLNKILLFGGSGAGASPTAFAGDGSTWTAVGGVGPAPSTEATLTFDAPTQQMVLIGASSSDAATWLFNGATWRRVLNQASTARARINHCAWFDQIRGAIVTYGGTTGASSTRETWEYRGVTGPAIVSAPAWQVSCRAGAASFSVQIAAAATADSVVWLKNGFTLAAGLTSWGSMVTPTASPDGRTFTLNIAGITDADSGGYQCVLTNACGGGAATNPATLRVCAADFNCSGSPAGDGVSEQDIFDFLTAWFGGDLRADIDRSGDVSIQDLFAFIAAYFAGC